MERSLASLTACTRSQVVLMSHVPVLQAPLSGVVVNTNRQLHYRAEPSSVSQAFMLSDASMV